MVGRRRRWWWVVVAGVLSCSSAAFASSSERSRVVVHGLRPALPELAGMARRVTEHALVHLGQSPRITVIGEAELELMLAHVQDRAALEEPDCLALDACLARMQDALDADKLISGHIGRMGNQLLVTLSVADARRGQVERGASAMGASEGALLAELGAVLDQLLGVGLARPDAGPGFALPSSRDGSSMAVLPLRGHDTRPGLAESMTQLLSLELKRTAGVAVITRDDVIAMVDFTVDRQRCLGDEDLSCLVELGGALGADHLVAGGVTRLGDSFVLHLALLDILTATALHRVIETYRGPEAQLPRAVRFAVAALLGRPVEGRGELEVVTDEAGLLALGGQEPLPLPLQVPLLGLLAGKHGLSIRAEGHQPYHAEVYIEPEQRVRFEPELIRLPTPWYQSWVFWAVAGVVAAGATTATILLLDPPTSGDLVVGVRR